MAALLHTRIRIRYLRISVIVALVFAAVLLVGTRTKRNAHLALQSDLVLGSVLDGTSEGESHRTKITQACKAHGFAALSPTHGKRRIYDLFLLSTELDWLEIRLHTLAPFVDFFVIVESRNTFTGLEKPLHLELNWQRFAPYHDKIIHRVVENSDPAIGSRTWDHEDYLRNALLNVVSRDQIGTDREAQYGDVLVVSDIDEIPKPATVALLRHCEFPRRLTLRSQFYYYSFQWLHEGEQWPHPQATIYQGVNDTISPKDLRNGESSHGWLFSNDIRRKSEKAELWDAAWHCSSCFATLDEMRTKLTSFSHTPWNTAENRDEKTMLNRVRQGQDLFGRSGESYRRIEHNKDVPAYVLEHAFEFGYLLDRDGKNAGFRDAQVTEDAP